MEVEQERKRWDEIVKILKKQEKNKRDATAVAVPGYMI